MSDPSISPSTSARRPNTPHATSLRRPETRRPPTLGRWIETGQGRFRSRWPSRGRQNGRQADHATPSTDPAPTGPASTDPASIDLVPGADLQLGPPRVGVFTALIAVGAAILALGLLWSWQSWTQRSAEPIDDLLPVLTASETEGASGAALVDEGGAAAGAADDGVQPAVEVMVPLVEALDTAATEPVPDEPAMFIVHVTGAVLRPGVVQVAADSRVFEAVDEAGGVTALADLERVNLAAPVSDGERLHVPRIGEVFVPVVVQPERPTPGDTASVDDASTPAPVVVDINAATEAELQTLPGVGPSIAQAIVQTRIERGPFFSVDELLEVPGIGETKLAAIRPHSIVIEP